MESMQNKTSKDRQQFISKNTTIPCDNCQILNKANYQKAFMSV